MGKKKADSELTKLVDELISEVGDDRAMLVEFTKKLIAQYTDEQIVGIAEYVAKLSDALTRQHQVKANTIKALAKDRPADDDDEHELSEIAKEIGLPFEYEDQGDGN